ncbi:MAG: haloacid dehalogenase-like hydrolase [Candidatus Limnocylindrales bacterium]
MPRAGAPVSLLVDYDGTISRLDVGDELLLRHVTDTTAMARQDAAYDAGRIGSRELMRWDMDVLPRDPRLLRREASEMEQDGHFPALVRAARAAGAAVEVVSDGLGFHVAPNLARLGLADVPVATTRNRLTGGGQGMSFPYGHPACFVCGTCKRERVRAHQALGRVVVYIGDGTSDRYAAFHADLVLAKDSLARFCDSAGWRYRAWRDFAEVTAWLAAALADGTLPVGPAEVATWRIEHPSMAARVATPFICGPEAWGPGRLRPALRPGLPDPPTLP